MLHKAERRTATTKRYTRPRPRQWPLWSERPWSGNRRASADYIHLYHGNAALLTESLEVIQKTSAVILAAIEDTATENDEVAHLPFRCHGTGCWF